MTVFEITKREKQILTLLAEGKTIEEISLKVKISEATVQSDLRILSGKLNAKNRAHLINNAYKYAVLSV